MSVCHMPPLFSLTTFMEPSSVPEPSLKVVSLGLDVGVPHASSLLPHNLHGTFLSAGAG